MKTTFVFLTFFISGFFSRLPDADVKVKPVDSVNMAKSWLSI
jgi:hypothetical protein